MGSWGQGPHAGVRPYCIFTNPVDGGVWGLHFPSCPPSPRPVSQRRLSGSSAGSQRRSQHLLCSWVSPSLSGLFIASASPSLTEFVILGSRDLRALVIPCGTAGFKELIITSTARVTSGPSGWTGISAHSATAVRVGFMSLLIETHDSDQDLIGKT